MKELKQKVDLPDNPILKMIQSSNSPNSINRLR